MRAGLVVSRNGMGGVGLLDHGPVVGEGRHGRRVAAARHAGGGAGPIGPEAEAAVGPAEAVEEMRPLERLRAVDPARLLELREAAAARRPAASRR